MTDGWKKREITEGVGIGAEDGQRKKVGGLLAEIRVDVGKNHSNVYELIQKDGDSLQVWGSTTIDGKLNRSDIGKFVKLEYLGMVQGKSGRKYKDIDVAVWEGALNDAMKAWPRMGEFHDAEQGNGGEPTEDFADFPEALDEAEDDSLPF
ncbi:hypothetical protein LCGC14_2418190 [marine sediment metagenome]|uniref:Uncharacterized protein n=1 Tax=marine sediment metagenome TaxID=412755 RepID=A0A0F9EJT2_9ZZZZ